RNWGCDGLPIDGSIQSVWSYSRSPSQPMAEDRVQRRLAAILAADVVGYSQLMGEDEAGTLAALKARRKHVLEPLVNRHRGRIFKVTGDGVLVEFTSAVNAGQCAVGRHEARAADTPVLP